MKEVCFKILFLLFLLSLKLSNSQSIEEAIKTKCDGKTIKYSIYAKLKEYLENEKNIDNRDIYLQLSDLKNKRIGIYKPTYRDEAKLKSLFNSIEEYDNKDNLVTDIIKNKIDGGIFFHGLANSIHMNSNILSAFPDSLYSVNLGFGLQKNNEDLKKQINEFINESKKDFQNLEVHWDMTNIDAGFLDTNLTGNKTLKVIAKTDSSPYCHLRPFDRAFIGAEVELIYKFAKKYGYKLNFTEANFYEEQYKALKEQKADIALGFFVIKEDNEIAFSDVLYSGNIKLIVRYSNLPGSHDWNDLYGSVEELNGVKLGLETGTFFGELFTEYFPNSEIVTQDSLSSLIRLLLLEEIDGFLFDKPVAEYLGKLYSWRLSYFDLEDLPKYQNGFAFQKNEEGNSLRNKFNHFLKKINLTEIYEKWIVEDYETTDPNYGDINYDPSQYVIDTNLNQSWELITVGVDFENKPISYFGQNDPKGIELDILYKFAKEEHYNINLISISPEERLSYIKEGKANITLGAITINEERKEYIHFSDPLYDSPIVMVVKIKNRKDILPIEIQDSQFETKSNNNVDVYVDFSIKNKNFILHFSPFL